MNDLAGFSEWTLALLPRLFLYPGGLWLLAIILIQTNLTSRLQRSHRDATSENPTQFKTQNSKLKTQSGLPTLATAWAAIALLPIPGATLLPFPIDRLALAGLLAVSLAFDRYGDRYEELRIELAILAAVVVPIAGHRTLLDTNGGLSDWISLLAVLVGMAAGSPYAATSLSLAVRLVGWLGLAATPLWTLLRLQDPLRVLAAFSIIVVAAALAGRLTHTRISPQWPLVVVCTLAALSLLTALLLPA